MQANTARGISLSFLCLAILGLMPIISNSRPGEFTALGFATFLSFWQLVCSLPLVTKEFVQSRGFTWQSTLLDGKQRRAVLIVLGTGAIFGLSTYAYVLSIEKAGAVNAVIAMQAYPLFAILWETLFLNRRKSVWELFFTFGLIGALYYLVTGGTPQMAGLSIWFGVALSVPFMWSIAHVILKEVLSNFPITPAQVTFFRVFVSTIFLLIVLIFNEGTGSVFSYMRNIDYQSIAFVMGLVYYMELIAWFYAVRHIDISLASSITAPAPAVTMVLAILVLGDKVEIYQLMSLIVLILSIYGLLLAGRARSPATS